MKANSKNFQDVLLAYITGLELSRSDGQPFVPRLDYFEADDEDLVLNLLPNGNVRKSYMDGSKEIELPFEVAVKSKDNQTGNAALWNITAALSDDSLNLPSTDDSYIFLYVRPNRPGFAGRDEQGYYVHTLNITAAIEIPGGNT